MCSNNIQNSNSLKWQFSVEMKGGCEMKIFLKLEILNRASAEMDFEIFSSSFIISLMYSNYILEQVVFSKSHQIPDNGSKGKN